MLRKWQEPQAFLKLPHMNRVTLKLEIPRLRNCSTRLIFQQIPDEIAGAVKSACNSNQQRGREARLPRGIKLHSHRRSGYVESGNSQEIFARQTRSLSLDYASENRALRPPTYRSTLWQTRTIRVQKAAERICKSRSPQLHTDEGTFYKDFWCSLELG